MCVENVIARESLASRHHLLTTDDAGGVPGLNVGGSGVGVESVHGVDGTTGHDHVKEGLFQGSTTQPTTTKL